MSENRVIVIAGPTASGKSALAIDVAKALNSAVVNCDSMQVYKHMPIISACPSSEEKKQIPHYLFEIYEPSFRGNVVDWLNKAQQIITELWAENKIPVVVGGTGLYIDNLINGTTPIPETSLQVRQEVAELLKTQGNEALYALLQQEDAQTASKLNVNDTTRIVRACEVLKDTGIKLSDWYKKPMIKKLPQAEFITVKICPQTQELDKRCYIRFDKMMQEGALEEVKYLHSLNLDESLPAMKALGVPELMSYLKGEVSYVDAVDNAKLHTRQYAKRQRTWFKNKFKADVVLNSCYKSGTQTIWQEIVKML